jgi:hypothetical protein
MRSKEEAQKATGDEGVKRQDVSDRAHNVMQHARGSTLTDHRWWVYHKMSIPGHHRTHHQKHRPLDDA